MRAWVERRPLAIIFLLYLLAGISYATSAPFLEVSDEVRHYALVEHLASGGGLPIHDLAQHERITAEERAALRPLTYYAQEGSQPPLYYTLMALVVQPFDRSDFATRAMPNPHARLGRADTTNNWNQLVHLPGEDFPWRGVVLAVMVLRFVGVLLGGIAVLSTYGLVLEFGASRPVALVAAGLVAFNPMFGHIIASVNNDTLAAALGALSLYWAARLIRREATWSGALVLGVLLGGAALTKASGLAVAIAAPAFVGISAACRYGVRRALSVTLAIWGMIVVVAGWWYARNALLYGDPTGTQMMAQVAGARERLPSLAELLAEWEGFYMAFWGLFGAVNIPMHPLIYDVLEGMLALAGLGLLLVLVRALRRSDVLLQLRAPSSLIALMAFSAFAIALAALVRWTSLTLASQGRLLFPVIAAIAFLVAVGLSEVARVLARLKPVALPFPLEVVAGLSITPLATLTLLAPWVYIRPSYALPPRIAESELPADLRRTELFFERGIRWIGFRVNTPKQRIHPGDVLDLTLYWQATQPISRNLSAFVRLFGRGEVELFALDTYPGGGMYQTTLWQPGEVIADRYRLRVERSPTATAVSPTTIWLDVGLWDFVDKRFVATFDGAGAPTGRQRYEAASLNVPSVSAPTSRQAVASFKGVEVLSAHLEKGNRSLVLVVDWRVSEDFSEDYTTFVQLFDAQGHKLEPQADGRALAGGFAPRWWRAGDLILGDRYSLPYPAGLPAAFVRFGLYRSDGVRLPVVRSALAFGQDYIELPIP
ncbi:MAG: glycosyltransferase family 39 protein [Anaerolineae bacterium]|nr:glycosyltransferase family 39 protein [Anaerolineae bacterium]